MLSMFTLPVSPAFCTRFSVSVPAVSWTVTEAVDQVSQEEVAGRLSCGPAAPLTLVDRVPVPPAALE
jgi:hypothetical protein